MFLEKIKYVTIEKKEWPLYCDINVMANIQDRFGTLDNWMEAISAEEPSFEDVRWTFEEFSKEGTSIINDETDKAVEVMTTRKAGRLITSYGIQRTVNELLEIFVESITGNEEKKVRTTQSKIVKKWTLRGFFTLARQSLVSLKKKFKG